jgi:uncharacterized protein
MTFTTTHIVPGPRDKVFAALIDPAILQKCIPGCESLTKTADNAYEAKLKIGIAGLKGSYTGHVKLEDLKAPESYTMVMEGKGVPGWVRGRARMQLAEKAGETEVRCDADAHVGGLIAAVGSRLAEAAAKKMMADFFGNLGRELGV